MKTQKILILGITGNLAKLKILPAIGQYCELHSNDLNIEVYGYSRSKADKVEIQGFIRSQIKSSNTELPKLTLTQGSYQDSSFYDELVNGLGKDDSLVVYLAVPPSVYIDFLQNSCPYSDRPIDILIEKPFGENLTEAIKILNIVTDCNLHNRVHFIDHYLFKSSMQLDILYIQQELSYNNLSFGDIRSIQIQALEIVDVKDRGGYYDQSGAIKDMFPHLYSMFDFGLGFFGNPKLDKTAWNIQSLVTDQYQDYKTDINNPDSTTETYFKAELNIPSIGTKSMNISLESGKKQSTKLTQLAIVFNNNTRLEFQIAPKNYLRLLGSDNQIIKDFKIKITTKLDHTLVFENVFDEDFGRFIPNDKILDYWELYTQITDQKKLI